MSYDGNFSVESIYKNMKMLSGDAFRSVAHERGISILDLGYDTNFPEEITRMGWVQNHHVAFGGGTESSYYRGSKRRSEKFGLPELHGQDRHYATGVQ